jgi:2-oxoglutarate ferredoxin oxidoreductase subunit alpha
MSEKILMKGNEALAEAAVRAGCRYYFGYPITPQNEIPAYMSWRLPEVGGTFIQAESEIASINMVYGAASCGVKVMTSSSSPGISLKQEGISYMAGAEVPALIVNMMRGGPGLGNIAPSQADYLQATKGGGHGDYNIIVLAPSTVQETMDLTIKAFDYAFEYRTPVMLLADGVIGQMSEPVLLPEMKELQKAPDWAMGTGGQRKIIHSLYLTPDNYLETHNLHLQEKYNKISKEVVLFEKYMCDDAESIFVSYGTPSRICKAAIEILRNKGIKIGLFRPISLWPFPGNELNVLADKILKTGNKTVFVVEMAFNQLEQDVKLALNGKLNVKRINKLGGMIFDEDEIVESVLKQIK